MPDEAATPDELVRYEVRDRVAHVTISNGKANALSPAVIAALDAALTRAEDAGEEQVGALLIAGAPGMLSGGFDLAVMRSGRGGGRQARDRRRRARSHACSARRSRSSSCAPVMRSRRARCCCSAPTPGSARRGAFRIGLIETQLGMVLPRWAAELARERLSPRQLQFATVGAQMYDPDGAVAVGFLDGVVEPEAAGGQRRGGGGGAGPSCPERRTTARCG